MGRLFLFFVRTLVIVGFFCGPLLSQAKLTTVHLGHVENFLNPDPNAKLFQDNYLSALYYALGENDSKLQKCGYKIDLHQYFYEPTDKLSLVESGQKLKNDKVWIVYGPRRSDDYLLLKRGLEDSSALVSPMANAFAVTSLPPPYFTMSQTTQQFTLAALQTIKEQKWGPSYGSIVDNTCSACKDFEEAFYSLGKEKFKRAFRSEVFGEVPNLDSVVSRLKREPVDFILIPNFAKISGYIISQLQKKHKNLKVLGADGWGEESRAYLGNHKILDTIEGFSFGAGLPGQKMMDLYKVQSLVRHQNDLEILPHYNAVSIIDFMRTLTGLLCQSRPKNKEQFLAILSKKKPHLFQSKAGIGIYQIKDSKPLFLKRFTPQP